MSTRDPEGTMKKSIGILSRQGLPWADADGLPESEGRFADGQRWHIEIPSVEGPAAMAAVLEQAKTMNLDIHRISQGSGIFMLTVDELKEMIDLGVNSETEVCLFVGPRASWDIGRQPVSSSGAVAGPTLRGTDQLRYALEDVLHAVKHGLGSILVGDIGLLAVLGKAKHLGDLPSDLIIKTSVGMPCTNAATAAVLVELGATTLNLGTDLSLGQIASIRSSVDAPLDVYVEAPDDFGGAVRFYEIPDLVRVAAPIHIKFAARNSPGLYPSGLHMENMVLNTARERVRRARLGVDILNRYLLDD
jgi:hypothetical protein